MVNGPATPGGPSKPTKPQPFWKSAQLASVGLEMGLAVLIGWGIGSWLDRKLGTAPWLMILFLLFGSAAGFKALIELAREAEARAKAGTETPSMEPPPAARESNDKKIGATDTTTDRPS